MLFELGGQRGFAILIDAGVQMPTPALLNDSVLGKKTVKTF